MAAIPKEHILALITEHLPFGASQPGEIREDSQLAELGLDSLHLITLLLRLQREYAMDINAMVEHGMPGTVSELMAGADKSPS